MCKTIYFHQPTFAEFFGYPIPLTKLPDDLKGEELLAFHSWESFVSWLANDEYFTGYIQVEV